MSNTDLLFLLKPIKKHLIEVEKNIAKEVTQSEFKNINQISRYVSIQQGKRLRPILVLATAQSMGPIRREHIAYATICELLHTATLLHDDVIDEAEVRRHRQSVNVRWGNTTSILLGDYLLARSSMMLSRMNNQALSEKVTHAAKEVCEGELLQVAMSRDMHLSRKNYFKMIRKKTASLFSICCGGSAMISGANPKIIKSFFKYGEALGMAFQITDDVIDLIGNASVEGKTLGTDLVKGKMTLPLINMRKYLNEKQKFFLDKLIIGRKDLSSIKTIQSLLRKTKSIENTLSKNGQYIKEAIDQLSHYQKNMKLDILLSLPEYIISKTEKRKHG